MTAPRPAPPGWTYLGSCDGGGGAWIAPLGTPWPPPGDLPGDLPGDGDDAGAPPEVHDAVITAAWQGRHADARRPDPPGGAR